MTEPTRNWAGNLAYRAACLHRPGSLEELQELVSRSASLRPLGTRHSFNDLADTSGDLVCVQGLNRDAEIDAHGRTVRVAAGVRYGDLGTQLHAAGFALHNTGSLPNISIAGANATGTHGSGVTNGINATAVSAIELVRADGEFVQLSRTADPETFSGAVVNLGALGVSTTLTLDIVPTYDVRQDVHLDLRFDALTEHLEQVLAAAYSVSLFTDWQGDTLGRLWLKHRLGDPDQSALLDELGVHPATTALHPVPGESPANTTEQLGVAGPWHERLPTFRHDHAPSVGAELQSEYFIPRERAAEAITGLRAIGASIAPVLLVSELRTVAADGLWLSGAYQRDSLAVHFTWRRDWAAVRRALQAVETVLDPLGARPHWGKLFTMSPVRIAALLPRLPDFARLAAEWDPERKFANPFLQRYVLGAS